MRRVVIPAQIPFGHLGAVEFGRQRERVQVLVAADLAGDLLAEADEILGRARHPLREVVRLDLGCPLLHGRQIGLTLGVSGVFLLAQAVLETIRHV